MMGERRWWRWWRWAIRIMTVSVLISRTQECQRGNQPTTRTLALPDSPACSVLTLTTAHPVGSSIIIILQEEIFLDLQNSLDLEPRHYEAQYWPINPSYRPASLPVLHCVKLSRTAEPSRAEQDTTGPGPGLGRKGERERERVSSGTQNSN